MPPPTTAAKDAQKPRLRLKAEIRDGLPVCPGADAFVQLTVELEPEVDDAAAASGASYQNFSRQTPTNDDDDDDEEAANARRERLGGGAVMVKQISVAWHGIERLDPAWVKPSPPTASRGDGGDGERDAVLPPGERYVARSPAGEEG